MQILASFILAFHHTGKDPGMDIHTRLCIDVITLAELCLDVSIEVEDLGTMSVCFHSYSIILMSDLLYKITKILFSISYTRFL